MIVLKKDTASINIYWYPKWLEYLKSNIYTYSIKFLKIGPKKVIILLFLPDFGWENKLVHLFYSLYCLKGHKKRIYSIWNHDSTQNSGDAIEFSPFFFIFHQPKEWRPSWIWFFSNLFFKKHNETPKRSSC